MEAHSAGAPAPFTAALSKADRWLSRVEDFLDLVAAFFIDIVNAFMIQFILSFF